MKVTTTLLTVLIAYFSFGVNEIKSQGFSLLETAISECKTNSKNLGARTASANNYSFVPLSANSPSFNSTMALDGLSMFIAEGIKKELNLAFFSKFEKFLKEDEHGDYIKTLFPSIHEKLIAIGKEIYNYDNYLKALRDAFIQDLRRLPLQTTIFLNQSGIIKDSKVKGILLVGLFVTQDVLDGKLDPLKIFEYIADNMEFDPNDAEIKKVLRISVVLFKMFFNSHEGISGYKNISVLNNTHPDYDANVVSYIENVLVKDINKKILDTAKYFENTYFDNILNEEQLLQDIYFLVEAMRNNFEEIEKLKKLIPNGGTSHNLSKESKVRLIQLQSNIINIVIDIIDKTKEIIHKTYPLTKSIIIKANSIIKLLHHTTNLQTNIRKTEYPAAIVDFTGILEQIRILDNSCHATSTTILCNVIDELLRYGSFIASIASSNSSQEVANVIQNFALPPGSSRIKKYSDFSISLNSYFGVFLGTEYLIQNNLEPSFLWSFTAPVGVGFNWGFKKAGSFSIFVSAIDVGALVAYRIEGNAETLPELNFANVLSPGLHFYYGFGYDLPISIGVGIQYGPLLRTINNNPLINTSDGFRVGVTLAVDLPITNFYVKDKKPKIGKVQ